MEYVIDFLLRLYISSYARIFFMSLCFWGIALSIEEYTQTKVFMNSRISVCILGFVLVASSCFFEDICLKEIGLLMVSCPVYVMRAGEAVLLVLSLFIYARGGVMIVEKAKKNRARYFMDVKGGDA